MVEIDAFSPRAFTLGIPQFLPPVTDTIAATLIDVMFSVFCQLAFSSTAFAFAEVQTSTKRAVIFLMYTFLTAGCVKLFFRSIAVMASGSIFYSALSVLCAVFALLYTGFASPFPGLDGGRKIVSWFDVSNFPFCYSSIC